MANIRINKFENMSNLHRVTFGALFGNATLHLHQVYIPGSISFNNIAVIKSIGNSANTLSLSFGLYSLSGSTLSLANSASQTDTIQNGASWVSLVTSVTQDITPGNWYFALLSSTAGQSAQLIRGFFAQVLHVGYGGPFFRGRHSASQTNMPASIATSDLIKETGATNTEARQPYILISA